MFPVFSTCFYFFNLFYTLTKCHINIIFTPFKLVWQYSENINVSLWALKCRNELCLTFHVVLEVSKYTSWLKQFPNRSVNKQNLILVFFFNPKSRVDFYLTNFKMGFNLVSYYRSCQCSHQLFLLFFAISSPQTSRTWKYAEGGKRKEKTQQKMQMLCYCVLVKGATLKKEKA